MAKARVFRGDPEHKQVALFDNFLGGLNTTEIDEQTRTNEFRELENVELIEEGRIQKRMGWGSAKRLNEAIFDNLDFENIYYFGVIKDEKNVLDRLDTFQGRFELVVDMIIQDKEISSTLTFKNIRYKAFKLTRVDEEEIRVEEINNSLIYSESNVDVFELIKPGINQIEILNYSGRKFFLLNQIIKDSEDIVEFYIDEKEKFIVNIFNRKNSYTPNAYEAKNVGYNLLKDDPLEVYTDNMGTGGIASVLITDYITNVNLISNNIYNTIVNTERFAIRILFNGSDSFFDGMEVALYYLQGLDKKYINASVEDLGVINGWKYYNISELKSFPENEEIIIEFIKATNDGTVEEFNTVDAIFDKYYNKTTVGSTVEKYAYLKEETNGRMTLNIAKSDDPFRYEVIKLDGETNVGGLYGAVFKPYDYFNGASSRGIIYNSGALDNSVKDVLDINSLKVHGVYQTNNYITINKEYSHDKINKILNLPAGNTLDYDFNLKPEYLPYENSSGIHRDELSFIENIWTPAIPNFPKYTIQNFINWLTYSGELSSPQYKAGAIRNMKYPAVSAEPAGDAFRLIMSPTASNRKKLTLDNHLNYTLELGEIFKVGGKYYEYNGATVEYDGSNKSAYFSEVQRPDIIYEYLSPFEVRNSEPIEINPISFKNAKAIIIDDRLVLYGGNTIVYSDIFSTAKNNIEQSFSYFPNYNTITLNLSSSDEIQKIAYYRGSHVIFTKDCIYRLGGVLNTDTMEVVMINDTIGCISAGSVRSLNNTIVFLTVDGLYSLRQNYYQDGLENVLKIDTKIKGVIPYGTNYESIVVNEQYLLHIKDAEGNYIKTLKQYYNMVNSSRELPYTVDVYREAPNTVFKIMGNMFGFHNKQIYMYGVGFTDFMSKEIIPDLKDEYAYPIKILTANWDLSHPIHEKKFKNLFIKLSSSSIVGIYFKIKVDKSVTTDSTQYLVEMNSRGELEYKIIRDPNINTFHTALVSSTNMTLGAGVLGQSYLGDVRYQVHKVTPAVKGRVIQLYFENNTADRLAIDSISLVYKLGKMRESV